MPENKDSRESVNIAYEPKEIGSVYANIAQVRTSPYDVTLTFGRRKVELEQEGSLVIADAIQVYMSPQHARSVAALLERQLDNYEELYGSIPSDTPKVVEPEVETQEDEEG